MVQSVGSVRASTAAAGGSILCTPWGGGWVGKCFRRDGAGGADGYAEPD